MTSISALPLTTNGVLLNDEIQEFVNQEMDNVVLSLDGRKEVNDRMRPFRNGKGSYDLIVPKFQKLAESRNQEKYYVRGTFTQEQPGFLGGCPAFCGSWLPADICGAGGGDDERILTPSGRKTCQRSLKNMTSWPGS